jgi:alpha-galactosidase
MAIDRVTRSVSSGESGVRLQYRHSGSAWTDPANRVIDEMSFRELFALAGLSSGEIEEFQDRNKLFIMSNGWQSWSPAWELLGRERVPPAFPLRKFGLFVDRPGQRSRRGAIHSHFYTYLRSGESYVGLFSRGESGAPVGFCLNRKSGSLRVDLHSKGKDRVPGALLAELRVVRAKGFFDLKDKVAAIYSGLCPFERLSFLKAKADRKTTVCGWESWYNHYSRIDEELVLKNLEALDGNDNFVNRYCVSRGKPTVVQVDDGWEIAVGDWDFNRERFPGGMKSVADRIRGKGFLPGIWIAPFVVTKITRIFHERPDWLLRDEKGRPLVVGWNPAWGGDFHALDLSRRDVREYLYAIFDRMVNEWGYRFLKLDFLYAGLFPGRHAEGGSAFQWYDEVVSKIAGVTQSREGRPIAYLGCGAPLEPSYRHFPLMRIGPDTREAWDYRAARLGGYSGRPSAWLSMRGALGRAFLDQSVFLNDPDVFFLREADCSLGETERELVALVDFMFGSQLMVSDDLFAYARAEGGDFTGRIVALFDRLSRDEYGAVRIDRDVWRIRSRSGEADGILNLRDRAWKAPSGFRLEMTRPIVSHIVKDASRLAFERRSASLFEVTPEMPD